MRFYRNFKKIIIDWLKLSRPGCLDPCPILLTICAYPYLNILIQAFENFSDKKLFLHDYGMQDYLDEFEIRPNPTAGMHDYSDEFDIWPGPTTGMHDNSDEFEIRPDQTMGMYYNYDKFKTRQILITAMQDYLDVLKFGQI